MDETLFGKVYYKLRQGVITNCDRYVKIATSSITNCEQVLQIATTVITNCGQVLQIATVHTRIVPLAMNFVTQWNMSTVFQSIKTVLPKLYLQSELKLCEY